MNEYPATLLLPATIDTQKDYAVRLTYELWKEISAYFAFDESRETERTLARITRTRYFVLCQMLDGAPFDRDTFSVIISKLSDSTKFSTDYINGFIELARHVDACFSWNRLDDFEYLPSDEGAYKPQLPMDTRRNAADNFAGFEAYLQDQGQTRKSIVTHVDHVRRALQEIPELNTMTVTAYVRSLLSTGNTKIYLQLITSSLRHYVAFMRLTDDLSGVTWPDGSPLITRPQRPKNKVALLIAKSPYSDRLPGFAEYLSQKYDKQKTIQNQITWFRRVLSYVPDLSPSNIELHFAAEHKRGADKSTLARYRKVVQLFGEYIGDQALAHIHPTANRKRPRRLAIAPKQLPVTTLPIEVPVTALTASQSSASGKAQKPSRSAINKINLDNVKNGVPNYGSNVPTLPSYIGDPDIPETLALELEHFKQLMLREGKRHSTINGTLVVLRRLYRVLGTLAPTTIETYIFDLRQKGRAASYLNSLIKACRIFGTFIGVTDYKNLKYFKNEETSKGILSDDEIEQFLAVSPESYRSYTKSVGRTGGINTARFSMFSIFFTILAYTGMRPSEVSEMRLRQVNLSAGVFELGTETKTHTGRFVPINPALTEFLRGYIATRTDERLFPPFNRDAWKEQFKMRIDALGIKRDKLTTYSFRHSFITRMLDQDVNLFKVQKMVGHKKLSTTAHYTHLTTKDVVRAISKDSLGRDTMSDVERMLQARKALEDLGFVVMAQKKNDDGQLLLAVSDEQQKAS